MEARLGGHEPGTLASLWFAVVAALVLTLTLEATPTAGASRKACQVRNAKTGQAYERLQQAVKAAKPGARLILKGTCHGKTSVNKDLTIGGVETRRGGTPALDGDGMARVLVIRPGASVRVKDLTVRDGRLKKAGYGGGIANHGSLTLRDIVVRHNRSSRTGRQGSGGGIHNAGSLSLLGGTKVVGNTASTGGGVYNAGTLLMGDSSSVRRNLQHRDGTAGSCYGVLNTGTITLADSSSIARNLGGGVWNQGYGVCNTGTITLADSSSVRDNNGGVLNNGGSITMTGSSTVRGNHLPCPPSGSGCIIWLRDPPAAGLVSIGGTLVGVNCAPQTYANVYGNTPDDCYIE